jgi:hypothetical protein
MFSTSSIRLSQHVHARLQRCERLTFDAGNPVAYDTGIPAERLGDRLPVTHRASDQRLEKVIYGSGPVTWRTNVQDVVFPLVKAQPD